MYCSNNKNYSGIEIIGAHLVALFPQHPARSSHCVGLGAWRAIPPGPTQQAVAKGVDLSIQN